MSKDNKTHLSKEARIKLRENSLIDLYHFPIFLSPTWRIIYQEAARGNELLIFGETKPTVVSEPENDRIDIVLEKILKSDSLTDIKDLINTLLSTEKWILKRILKKTYESWSYENKCSLN